MEQLGPQDVRRIDAAPPAPPPTPGAPTAQHGSPTQPAPPAQPALPAHPGPHTPPGPPAPAGLAAYGYPAQHLPQQQIPPPQPPVPPGPPPEGGAAGGGGTAVLLAALVGVLAVASGVTAYLLLGGSGTGRDRTPQAADSRTPQVDGTPNPDGASGAPSASPSPSGTADEDGIPDGYLGGWEREADGNGSGTLRIRVNQGEIGDTVVTIVAEGPSYRCEFRADLRAPGPPVELGPSRVTAKSSEASCQPGPTTTLELTDDGSLRRTFDDGRAPHLYSPAR